MALRITGTVRIETPGPGRKFVRSIVNRIAWELESQSVGRIEEERTTVRFRRNAGLRYNRGLFVSFDPGEFVVEAERDSVAIRYTLGLGPLYFVLAMVPLGFAYGLSVSHDLLSVLVVFALVLLVLGSAFLFTMWKIRAWLRAAATTAIAKAGQPKE